MAPEATDVGAEVKETAARAAGRLGQVRAFAKEHPVTVLAVAAAAGAIAGVEWAAGALVGLGAAALLGNKSGRELRDEVMRRGRALLERGKQKAGEVATPAQGSGPT